MNLDALNIMVRERTLGELFDLALLLFRRHVRDVLCLMIVGCMPWMLADLAIMAYMPTESWYALPWLVVLIIAQAPIACAPLTVYMGEAMFSHKPSVMQALRLAYRRAGPLLMIGLMRAAFVAVPVAFTMEAGDGLYGLGCLLLLMFFPAHVLEVILLERQPVKESLERAQQLMSAWRSEGVSHLLVALLAIIGGVGLVTVTVVQVTNILFWNAISFESWQEWFHPAKHLISVIAPWPILSYLTIVRFLAYIDLRTRREGWDVELELRRAGRRIEPVRVHSDNPPPGARPATDARPNGPSGMAIR